MGFRPERKTVLLKFEDPDLAGLEVHARIPSLGRLLEVDAARAAIGNDGMTGLHKFFELFADALDSWNLEDEFGNEVVKNVDGLLSLDTSMAMTIVLSWFDAVTAIGKNLEKGSTSGERFPEVSIPMELPSPNLPNLPKPN